MRRVIMRYLRRRWRWRWQWWSWKCRSRPKSRPHCCSCLWRFCRLFFRPVRRRRSLSRSRGRCRPWGRPSRRCRSRGFRPRTLRLIWVVIRYLSIRKILLKSVTNKRENPSFSRTSYLSPKLWILRSVQLLNSVFVIIRQLKVRSQSFVSLIPRKHKGSLNGGMGQTQGMSEFVSGHGKQTCSFRLLEVGIRIDQPDFIFVEMSVSSSFFSGEKSMRQNLSSSVESVSVSVIAAEKRLQIIDLN